MSRIAAPFLFVLLLTFSACGGGGGERDGADTTAVAEGDTTLVEEGAYFEPVTLEQCEALQGELMRAFGVRATLIDAPFEDPVSQQTGTACTVEMNATGTELGSLSSIETRISSIFSDLGWEQAPAYAADGPAGFQTAFETSNLLAVVEANWEPAPEADCPEDRPISDCRVTPAQQQYIVTVRAVRAPAAS